MPEIPALTVLTFPYPCGCVVTATRPSGRTAMVSHETCISRVPIHRDCVLGLWHPDACPRETWNPHWRENDDE